MSKTRRDQVQTITRDWGVCPVDGWQAVVKEELRALYAREKLLEAVVERAESVFDADACGHELLGEALDALDAYDKENPR